MTPAITSRVSLRVPLACAQLEVESRRHNAAALMSRPNGYSMGSRLPHPPPPSPFSPSFTLSLHPPLHSNIHLHPAAIWSQTRRSSPTPCLKTSRPRLVYTTLPPRLPPPSPPHSRHPSFSSPSTHIHTATLSLQSAARTSHVTALGLGGEPRARDLQQCPVHSAPLSTTLEFECAEEDGRVADETGWAV